MIARRTCRAIQKPNGRFLQRKSRSQRWTGLGNGYFDPGHPRCRGHRRLCRHCLDGAGFFRISRGVQRQDSRRKAALSGVRPARTGAPIRCPLGRGPRAPARMRMRRDLGGRIDRPPVKPARGAIRHRRRDVRVRLSFGLHLEGCCPSFGGTCRILGGGDRSRSRGVSDLYTRSGIAASSAK